VRPTIASYRQHVPRPSLPGRAPDAPVLEPEGHVVEHCPPRQQRVFLEDHRRERGARPLGFDAYIAGALAEEAGHYA